MFVHDHVSFFSVPRYASIAPRNTWSALSGVATTYQSYQAWLMFIPSGRFATLVQLLPIRRQRYATVPAAPNTYATSGVDPTRSTASRVHTPAGAPGSGTAVNEF